MKYLLLTIIAVISISQAKAQQIENIYIHLYTDSLKKGTNNYINIDGKTRDGRWIPLTANEIDFSSSYGKFDGNDLILPAVTPVNNVTVKAVLKTNPSIYKQITIWIKQKPDPVLPANDNGTRLRNRRTTY